MATIDIPNITIFEDTGVSLMRRVTGNDAANIVQVDIASIKRNIYANGTLIGTEVTLTVSDVVFDALQTDARWTTDSTGYNFRDDVSASAFPTGDVNYVVEYLFTPASGEVFHVLWRVLTKCLERS